MNRIQGVIAQYDFNLKWADSIVVDLDETQMTVTPCKGLENHPAFTLGHLATGSALLAEDLGGVFQVPDGWDELFLRKGPGDPRLPNPDLILYPDKQALLRELQKQHEAVKGLLLSKDEKTLNSDISWRYKKYFPTIFDLVNFMCISHESMHLGQLSAWRRAMGLPSALAGL